MRTLSAYALVALIGLLTPPVRAVHAQQPVETQLRIPAAGEMAPDFVIRGATRYGLLAERTRLSQLRGQTVVLAFIVMARTRG